MKPIGRIKLPFYGLLDHYLINQVQCYWESLEKYI